MTEREYLISVLVPSRRLEHLKGLIESLRTNTADLSRIQLIVKFDEDQRDLYEAYLNEQKKKPGLALEWVCSPRLFGAFSMWIHTQLMWKRVAKGAYFVFLVTDEGRFALPGWDDEVASFKGFYPDHIFRLRLSISRYANYYCINQTVFMPECFPIYTRRWLELTNGFGDCWGSDSFQESVSYHLGRGTGRFWLCYPRNYLFRDLVLHKRIITGIDDFAKDVGENEKRARTALVIAEWKRLVSNQAQTAHCMLARKLLLAIEAERQGCKNYTFLLRSRRRIIAVRNEAGQELGSFPYHVPRWFTGWAWFQFFLLGILFSISPEAANSARVVNKQTGGLVRLLMQIILLPLWLLRPKHKSVFPLDPNYPVLLPEAGTLYKLKNGRLQASQYMLSKLKQVKYVTCTDEELNYWLDKAFARETGSSEADEALAA